MMKKRLIKTTTPPPLKLTPDLYGHYSDPNDYSSSVGFTLQKKNFTLKSHVGASPGYKFGDISADYSIPIKNNTLDSAESLTPCTKSDSTESMTPLSLTPRYQ